MPSLLLCVFLSLSLSLSLNHHFVVHIKCLEGTKKANFTVTQIVKVRPIAISSIFSRDARISKRPYKKVLCSTFQMRMAKSTKKRIKNSKQQKKIRRANKRENILISMAFVTATFIVFELHAFIIAWCLENRWIENSHLFDWCMYFCWLVNSFFFCDFLTQGLNKRLMMFNLCMTRF